MSTHRHRFRFNGWQCDPLPLGGIRKQAVPVEKWEARHANRDRKITSAWRL